MKYLIYNRRDGRAGWMNNCIVWWRPEGRGYTYSVDQAGRFTEEEAKLLVGSGGDLMMVPEDVADSATKKVFIAYLDDLPHQFVLEKDGRRRVKQESEL